MLSQSALVWRLVFIMKGYILIKEWNYHTKSCRKLIDNTFDTIEEAIEEARMEILREDDKYYKTVGFDGFPSTYGEDGVIKYLGLFPPFKNCKFYFIVRIIEIESITF